MPIGRADDVGKAAAVRDAPARGRDRDRDRTKGPHETSTAMPAPDPRAQTASTRVIIGIVSLSALALGAVGYLTGHERLRTGELLVFCLVGLGSALWQLMPRIGLAERAALTFLVGWSTLTAVPMMLGSLGFWYPGQVFVGVAVVAAGLHVVGLIRAVQDAARPTPTLERLPPSAVLPPALGLLGALVCVLAAVQHQHLEPGIWGFLPHIGPAWYVGLVVIGIAFVLARPGGPEAGYALPVLLIVLVLTLTPAIVYDGPRSQAAAKHVDLVMQIRTWHVPRSSVGIYNGWDGFFAAVAWLCDVAGIRDPMRLATFWPPLLAGFRVATLRYLFGALLSSSYAAWAAVLLAVLADPIGADYFSPQSVGFILALLTFGVALREERQRRRVALVLTTGLLLAVTHQLSPYAAGGVLCVLVVFRQVRPWWLPAAVLAPAGGWALLHRDQLSGFLSLKDLGNLQNFRPPKAVGGNGLDLARLPVVGDTVHALLLGLLVLGLLAAAALVRRPRNRQGWAMACCPAVGLALVAANPYGQEGIFRAILFGLPWLAVLAVRLLSAAGPDMFRIAVGGVAGLLASTFLAASFGLDGSNVVRPGDVAADRAFVATADRAPELTPALLVLGVGDLPTSPPPVDASYRIVTREDLHLPVGLRPDLQKAALVQALTAALLAYTQQDPRRAELYAWWSPVSVYYGVEYGLQPPQDFAALRNAFEAASYWHPVFHQGGSVIFKLDPAAYARLLA